MGIHLDNRIVSAVKRQISFLVGGTITGIVMTHFLGFPITLVVNSAIWYVISQIWYRVVWQKKGIEDQKLLLKYLLTKIRPQKYSRYSHNLDWVKPSWTTAIAFVGTCANITSIINTIKAEVILDTLVKNAYAICSEAR